MPAWQIILLAIALLFAASSVFMWVWNVVRAKKMRSDGFVNKVKDSKKTKTKFKLDKFISALGGIDNIISTSVIDTNLKISILSHDKVDFNQLKKLNNDGIAVQSDNITITLGKSAVKINQMINDLIKLDNTKINSQDEQQEEVKKTN